MAETHYATNRCEISLRLVASSTLQLRQSCLSLCCRYDMSNEFKPVWILWQIAPRSVAATMIFTWDDCYSNLSRRRVAAICRIVCLGLSSVTINHYLVHFLLNYMYYNNYRLWFVKAEWLMPKFHQRCQRIYRENFVFSNEHIRREGFTRLL